MRITIIGAGEIGSHVAFLLLERNIINDINITDINCDLAEGQAMDLNQYLSERLREEVVQFNQPLDGSDIIVICVGRRRVVGEIRCDLEKDNTLPVISTALLVKNMKTQPIVIMVTNPLDIMTRVFYESAGLPTNKVIGMGSSLDTARFREVLREKEGRLRATNPCIVLGKHGEEMQVYPQRYVLECKSAAIRTIAKKGATVFAPATCIVSLIEAIVNDSHKVIPVSNYRYGQCYSTVEKIGKDGICI